MTIPYVTLADPHAAMALYEKALGATTVMVMDGPGGSVMHACRNADWRPAIHAGKRMAWHVSGALRQIAG